MIINEDLKIESEIPFQQISHLNFQWQINEHATAVLSGVLEAQKESDFILKKAQSQILWD